MNTVWREGCTRVGSQIVFDRTGEFVCFQSVVGYEQLLIEHSPVDIFVSHSACRRRLFQFLLASRNRRLYDVCPTYLSVPLQSYLQNTCGRERRERHRGWVRAGCRSAGELHPKHC